MTHLPVNGVHLTFVLVTENLSDLLMWLKYPSLFLRHIAPFNFSVRPLHLNGKTVTREENNCPFSCSRDVHCVTSARQLNSLRGSGQGRERTENDDKKNHISWRQNIPFLLLTRLKGSFVLLPSANDATSNCRPNGSSIEFVLKSHLIFATDSHFYFIFKAGNLYYFLLSFDLCP